LIWKKSKRKKRKKKGNKKGRGGSRNEENLKEKQKKKASEEEEREEEGKYEGKEGKARKAMTKRTERKKQRRRNLLEHEHRTSCGFFGFCFFPPMFSFVSFPLWSQRARGEERTNKKGRRTEELATNNDENEMKGQ
jgi:hypothetical protein